MAFLTGELIPLCIVVVTNGELFNRPNFRINYLVSTFTQQFSRMFSLDYGPKRRPPIKFLVAETRVFNDHPVATNMASREHYLQYGVRIVD